MQRPPWTSLFLAIGPHPIPQAPPTRGPGLAEGDGGGQKGGSHLLGFPPFCEEVLLQSGIGLRRPPGLIAHTEQPAQGQANKSGCRGDKSLSIQVGKLRLRGAGSHAGSPEG